MGYIRYDILIANLFFEAQHYVYYIVHICPRQRLYLETMDRTGWHTRPALLLSKPPL